MEPKIGESVMVWPTNGEKIQVDGIFGRFLKEEGQTVIWSYWYHSRLHDGSITFVNPIKTDKQKKG